MSTSNMQIANNSLLLYLVVCYDIPAQTEDFRMKQ